MSNQNKAQKQMIVGIKDTFFEIPPYQRLYEWGKDEIETLLDDMKKAYNEGKGQYFIGNITTSIDKDDSNKFVLIDGQQRLTTLWFIGFYLASKGCGEWKTFITQGDKLRIAMPIRDKEKEVLENLAKKIQKSEIKPNKEKKLELSKDLQGIHQKIIDAFGYIESWFNENFSKDDNKKEIDSERLNCFANFIYTKICFVFVELAPKTDLNRFFVRMNNRGKQLEKHEILKARMLGEIRKKYDENGKLIKDTNDEIWQKYAKIWDLCSDMNKYIFQSASDRNIFEKENKNDDTPDKVESIIDFPTFLLHCYKLFIVDKLLLNEKGKYAENEILEILKKITITQDKLLEIMWDDQTNNGKNKEVILDGNFIFNIKNDTNRQAKANCKEFIESILRYRVLFDYFVIKDDVRARSSNNYKIMRLNESKDNYSLPENSKKGELTSGVFHDLVIIQNYLRVARQGDRQNYHHWLTPFLKFLDNQICLEMDLSLMKNCEFDFTNFKCGAKKIAEQFSKDECDGRQKVLVRFLENLDTKLAIKQLSKTNENVLLNIANTILININEHLNFQEEKSKIEQISKWREKYKNIFFYKKCFLNNGTNTPHYWFYRLEYYLWKDRENKKYTKVIFDNKSFKDIADKFYFRNLNSVEHIQPQSRAEDEQKNWRIYKDKDNKIIKRDIDCFGNLALLSVGFNSSLSNQDNADKRLDLQKKINKSEVESLKLWLVYANYPKDEDWTHKNAQAHQNQMLDILIKSLKSSQEK